MTVEEVLNASIQSRVLCVRYCPFLCYRRIIRLGRNWANKV